MKLDRSKPFCTVYGDSEAAFEQEGVLFSLDGESIGGEPQEPKNKGGRPRKEAVDPEIDAQIKANMEA